MDCTPQGTPIINRCFADNVFFLVVLLKGDRLGSEGTLTREGVGLFMLFYFLYKARNSTKGK